MGDVFLSCAPASANEADMVTDAVVELVGERGLPALTMRGLARTLRMNPGIVNQWFGSRSAMLEQVTYRLGGRWLRCLATRCHDEWLLGLLPPLPGPVYPTPWGQQIDEHQDAMSGLRVWLALIELGRSEEAVARPMVEIRRGERELVARVAAVDSDATEMLLALVHGLRCSLFGAEPMHLDLARTLLSRELHAFGLDPASRTPSAGCDKRLSHPQAPSARVTT